MSQSWSDWAALKAACCAGLDSAARWVTDCTATVDGLEVRLTRLARVTVADLADVLEHRIVRCCGSTSHFLVLRGGSEVRFAYSDKGELLELSARRVRATLTGAGDLVFAPFDPEQ